MSAADTTFRIIPLVFAALMLGWVIAYWQAGSKLDQCNAEVQVRIERVKGKIQKNQSLLAEITRLTNAGGASGGPPR